MISGLCNFANLWYCPCKVCKLWGAAMGFTIFGYGFVMRFWRDAQGIFAITANLTWVRDEWCCEGERTATLKWRNAELA